MYKVDGFRFDLMGLIDVTTILDARHKIALLPNKNDILFEGEGWKMYRGPKLAVMSQDYMTHTEKYQSLTMKSAISSRAEVSMIRSKAL